MSSLINITIITAALNQVHFQIGGRVQWHNFKHHFLPRFFAQTFLVIVFVQQKLNLTVFCFSSHLAVRRYLINCRPWPGVWSTLTEFSVAIYTSTVPCNCAGCGQKKTQTVRNSLGSKLVGEKWCRDWGRRRAAALTRHIVRRYFGPKTNGPAESPVIRLMDVASYALAPNTFRQC